MSNVLILRTVYALNSNTGQNLSSGQILVTDGLGGTFWTSVISSLSIIGGSVMDNLPSTISTFSTQIYFNTAYFGGLSSMSTDMYHAISTLSTAIANTAGTLSKDNLVSSMAGLGSIGWVSTPTVYSIISSVSAVGEVSPSSISTIASEISSYGIYNISTINTINISSYTGLGSIGYISSGNLVSSLEGLASEGYISSSTLMSTVNSLGSLGYISSASLVSSIQGFGIIGYISTASLRSTIVGLGSFNYISTASLYSAINQAFSTVVTVSTVRGLGSVGYISTASLVSSMMAISIMKTDVRFDNTDQVTVIGGTVHFANVQQVIYISSFLTSSLFYSGNNGTQLTTTLLNSYDMLFSTASINLTPFSGYINSNSRITLDIYPTLAFTKLATGASAPVFLSISSFLQQGLCNLYNTTTTSYMYAGNTVVNLENGTTVDSSNIFSKPIRIQIPPSTVTTYTQPYTLVHYMQSSINQGSFQNALHSNFVTPQFGSTGSVFVSVQNIM